MFSPCSFFPVHAAQIKRLAAPSFRMNSTSVLSFTCGNDVDSRHSRHDVIICFHTWFHQLPCQAQAAAGLACYISELLSELRSHAIYSRAFAASPVGCDIELPVQSQQDPCTLCPGDSQGPHKKCKGFCVRAADTTLGKTRCHQQSSIFDQWLACSLSNTAAQEVACARPHITCRQGPGHELIASSARTQRLTSPDVLGSPLQVTSWVP